MATVQLCPNAPRTGAGHVRPPRRGKMVRAMRRLGRKPCIRAQQAGTCQRRCPSHQSGGAGGRARRCDAGAQVHDSVR
eukprot:gene25392-biopygen16494